MTEPSPDAIQADLAATLDRIELVDEKLAALEPHALRPLKASEDRKLTKAFDVVEADLEGIDRDNQRVAAELERVAAMDAALAKLPLGAMGGLSHITDKGTSPMNVPTRVTREPLTYMRTQEGGKHSFLADLWNARAKHDQSAIDRLNQHRREVDAEIRNGPQTTTDTQGGDFVPPLYIGEMFAGIDRAGRPFANAVRNLPLPDAGMSVSIPRVTTGHLTGSQDGENTTLAHRDAVTDDVETSVKTIGGYGDASRQSLDRSSPGLDQVLFEDMIADYAMQLDTQLLNGTGNNGQHKGLLEDSNRHTITWTSASPSPAALYTRISDAATRIVGSLKRPANAIFMHPRRWYWLLSVSDDQSRPIIAPIAPQNSPGQFATGAEGLVGSLQGLPVYLDSNLPTLEGTGTNEDVVIVTKLDENLLWESSMPSVEVSEHVGFTDLTVTYRLFAYSAWTSERKSGANCSISGTGLSSPDFSFEPE